MAKKVGLPGVADIRTPVRLVAIGKEIDMAVADWKCADAMDYQDKYQEIDFRLQQKFVDDHADQLDALIAKYGNK